MARASPIQTNFTAGELSRKLGARVDFSKYNNGCFLLENFVVMPQGGVTRRPGTKHVHYAKNHNKDARLIPFKFSTTQNYIIEMGDLYMRFFKDNGLITLTSQNISAITKANPAVVTYVGADTYANGDRVFISGVVGMIEVNNREFTVANVNAGANTFELSGVNSTNYGTYTSGGTVAEIFELATVYTEAQIRKVKWAQSADTLYLTHKSVRPKVLTRTGHTSWTIGNFDFQDGPYLDTNASTTTLTPAATTGAAVNVTASASTFVSTDVGRHIRIKNGATWGWCEITGYTSATQVTVNIKSAFAATSATADWALGLWSDTTGWPSCVAFYEERLWFGGTTNNPQTMTASMSGSYSLFSPTETDGTVTDEHGLNYTIATDDVNAILWMSPGKVLSVFTSAAEFTVSASNLNEAVTPTNIKVSRETNRGTGDVRPVRIDHSVLFWQRSGRKLREYSYSFNTDSFQAPDMSVLAEHISSGGILDMDYQQEPYQNLWIVRNDGHLISMTYNREQEVIGWHRHPIAGTNAIALSVAVIPSVDTFYDEVWLITERDVNGSTVRAIEYITGEVEPVDSTDKDYFYFMDAGATYDGAPTATVSGLNHLIGETVSILADGAVVPDQVVSASGTITLTRTASVIQIGLNYKSKLLTVGYEAGGNEGTSQGKIGRIHKLAVRFFNTLGAKVGHAETHTERILFRTPSMPMGSSPALFSGDKVVAFNADYDTERQIYVEQDQPYPCTILGVMPSMVVYG